MNRVTDPEYPFTPDNLAEYERIEAPGWTVHQDVEGLVWFVRNLEPSDRFAAAIVPPLTKTSVYESAEDSFTGWREIHWRKDDVDLDSIAVVNNLRAGLRFGEPHEMTASRVAMLLPTELTELIRRCTETQVVSLRGFVDMQRRPGASEDARQWWTREPTEVIALLERLEKELAAFE